MIYFDYAATTPPYEEVADTVAEVMKRHYGNPSSLHRLGVEAEALVARARETIAQTLEVSPQEIVFTGSGTESNTLAILGAVRRFKQRGNHIITTQIEHASVYETYRKLESEGFRVTYLPVDETGQVRLEELENSLTPETILVSVMFVNNEMGRIQPIERIGRLLQRYPKALFHVDGVQAYGKLDVKPKQLGIDLMACSAHKFRGPKGVGFLYCRSGLELEPLLLGGGQEQGLRSGTENVPALVGMAKAARLSHERRPAFYANTRELRRLLVQGIKDIPELVVNGSEEEEDMAPHIVHFSYPGMKSEVVVHALEQHDIYISTRSACSSGEAEPSRVLVAMDCPRERSISGLRISYGLEHTKSDAETFLRALRQVVKQLAPTATKPGRR
ncbi:cysteine desulfurase family protein [Paenibacillus hamazuiensis]|uniref:cysteine desulfurase family protein n=1 Tax=Paenibacillus hamazuiensis TaxID=2936508 RepID=UPI00200CF14A|nr:cysteine desulfurase family protein [Paenibacillus hamazuiensis]